MDAKATSPTSVVWWDPLSLDSTNAELLVSEAAVATMSVPCEPCDCPAVVVLGLGSSPLSYEPLSDRRRFACTDPKMATEFGRDISTLFQYPDDPPSTADF